MTLPVLQYLVAFNNGPLDDPAAITTVATPAGTLGAHNVWTDITPYVMGYQRSGGRQHELSQFEGAEVSLDLNNQDGRFNPWNTSGPYTGRLTIRKPLRVQATVGGTTYVRFTGHVDAWPTLWADPVTHFAQVHATDAFRILNLADLASLGYHTQVVADGATQYWPCDDAVGSPSCANSTGTATLVLTDGTNPQGQAIGVTLSGPNAAGPLATQSSGYADTGPYTSNNADFPGALLAGPGIANAGGPFSIEMWVKLLFPPLENGPNAFMQNRTITPTNAFVIGFAGGADGIVFMDALVYDPTGTNWLGQAQMPGDGNWHHLVITYASGGGAHMCTYLDGVLTWTSTPTAYPSLTAAQTTTFGGSAASTNNLCGGLQLSNIAYYETVALTAAQVLHHFKLGQFSQESTDARIGQVLDTIGWPAGARTLDPGVSTVQAVTSSLVTTSALSHLQACEATEGGALFIDGTGKVRFVNRHSFITNAVFATSQATFDDTGGIPWAPGPALALDDIDLYNEARGQRAGGGLQVTSDATSVAANGRSTWQPSGQLIGISDAEVLGMTQYVVNNHKTPKSRLQAIDVNLAGLTAAQQQTVLGLGMLYRITVNRTGVPGTAFSQVGLIEHISETATPGTWTVTFGLDVADTTGYWVLGQSQLGVNTALAY